MTALARFSITTDAVGHGQVVVNGEDVSKRVTAVSVSAELGRPTVVTLHHLASSGDISGEGIVHVLGRSPADWLATIDPQELEQAALASMGGLDGGSTGEAFLEVLKGWA